MLPVGGYVNQGFDYGDDAQSIHLLSSENVQRRTDGQISAFDIPDYGNELGNCDFFGN